MKKYCICICICIIWLSSCVGDKEKTIDNSSKSDINEENAWTGSVEKSYIAPDNILKI